MNQIAQLRPARTSREEARRFVLAFLCSTCCGLAALAALNVAIDPFGAFGVTLIPADSRTGDTRTARGELLHRFRGETVLIGSSRTRVAYDGGLPCVPGGPACNVGLDGTHLSELSLVVDEAARNPQVRRIVLSLDLHLAAAEWRPNADFRCSRFNPDRSELDHWCDLLWNGRTIEASVRAIRRYASGVAPQHDEFGFARGAGARFERAAQAERSRAALDQFLQPGGLLNELEPPAVTRTHLRRIVDTCRRRGIHLTIVLEPVHCLLLEGLRARGLWDDYRQWKRDVLAVAEPAGASVWDFSGYSEFTTEPLLSVNAAESRWFWEPSHMRAQLGERVLRRIFHAPGADERFGVLLTSDRLAGHFARLESAGALWRAGSAAEFASLGRLIGAPTSRQSAAIAARPDELPLR